MLLLLYQKVLLIQKIKREDYFFPDKGDGKEFNNLLKENNIEFEFMKEHQGKLPDLVLKINGVIYIVEHKEIRCDTSPPSTEV